MKSSVTKTVALSTVALAVAACSGGGGGGGSASGSGYGSSTSAQFIDAPVKGLTFSGSNGSSGTTAAAGKFSCKRGEVVEFTLKGLKIGRAACGEKIFVHDLFAPSAGGTSFTWQKAAAVIQSFATGTSELDLTAANASVGLDLSGLAYSNGSFDTAVSGHVTSSGISGAAHVSTAAATTAANNSFAEHNTLNDTLAAGLDYLATNGDGTAILKAGLTSGTVIAGEQWCSNNIQVKVKITKTTVATKPMYTLSIDKVISYNSAANEDATCTSGTTTEACRQHDAAEFPNAKVITGANFDMASIKTVDDYSPGLDVRSETAMSLSATATSDDVVLSGNFYNKVNVLETSDSQYSVAFGKDLVCTYALITK